MDYTQERVATLHDYGDADPPAPAGRAAVVVPMTDREYASLATERVFSELERVDPAAVVVPLRAPAERVPAFREWLAGFDLDLTLLWCDGPRVEGLLADAGLDGPRGKGRDVWLALGVAARHDFVVLHDADTDTYEARDVNKLLFPLADGFEFSKGYYARVENDRLYGRLFRLFYTPLVAALEDTHDHDVLDFLGSFRYALAGECGLTSEAARGLRVQREWGLEVGTLGEAFRLAGAAGVAQVDLGRYEHDHRAVSGPTGLSEMSRGVGAALLRAVADTGVDIAYDTVRERYREHATRLVDAYSADAAFNDLSYDAERERDQITTYAQAVQPPGADTRLPAWSTVSLTPGDVAAAARADAADTEE
ncbi:glycosyl transferase family 2 [Halobacterium salinarum]|uniref:glycosyl transferase family 2 n=1 Tax=Halobacterium TaxID=2239 RepID=UPI00196410C0|nr:MULTISPECIES: glycosyl transferase family 2 [Halobacterium]MCF2164217.1 glycosyl transferase family 2 [Halobacterium salinarum]MCF2166743.1 glycosyl transferase family 2 [Halobacterium salinarum]MCF2237880.1 glycosyl transferase family 2 [Halobacterium salinarum]MDL0120164.1 glycosyl transferase family 2 [Halobacterium salinarum]MDL0128929.1 glycosyl transferase family 2 [Halobacterium salinarum]